MLLPDVHPNLPEPMDQGIFINLLEMSMTMISMDRICRFSNKITKFKDIFQTILL
jgi:hypothetical protein